MLHMYFANAWPAQYVWAHHSREDWRTTTYNAFIATRLVDRTIAWVASPPFPGSNWTTVLVVVVEEEEATAYKTDTTVYTHDGSREWEWERKVDAYFLLRGQFVRVDVIIARSEMAEGRREGKQIIK